MTSRRSRNLGLVTTVGLFAVVAGPALAQSAAELFYERTVMSAADARCRLFDRPTSSALQAGASQARGAALRAGSTSKALREIQQRATGKAASVACASPDLTLAASRVRTGFAGYARLQKMSYPGDTAAWEADRATSARLNMWGLSQSVRFGYDRMTFGIASGPTQAPALTAMASFADGATPYAARLVLRDAQRAGEAYLDKRSADAKGRIPLAARMPPGGATTTFAAKARDSAPRDLLTGDVKSGWSFRFPPAAAEALAQLDPREAAAVEFLFANRSGGDTVRRAYLEVGDFAAGRAFLRATQAN
jgi:hypothetical protein